MNVAFRVDASSKIGTGHLMRCLTLADALKQRGANCRFVSRHLPDHLRSMLVAKGHEFTHLDSLQNDMALDELAHAPWLGVSQAQDAADSTRALSDRAWDWLIVDHYALDSRWESMLRQLARRILIIDDIADRQHDCDVLLDQNFYADMNCRYDSKVPSHCQLLLGPRYALLRDAFSKLREQVKPRTGAVKKILVFFGGVDTADYTGQAIQALAGISGLHVDVVIGANYPYREQIQQACAMQGYVCHVQSPRMAELMAEADLAIGAGGTATWERCCLGLPALSLCVADNQREQIADAAEAGLLYAPSSHGDVVELIRSHARCLLENASVRTLISNNAMHAVDGRGTSRIMRELGFAEVAQPITEGVYIRLAVADDAHLVWPWRNSEATRQYFFDPSPVSLADHIAWWSRSQNDSRRILLLGGQDGQEFGVIRFDFEDSKSAVVSIYLDPAMTGRGLGRALLLSGLDWLKQHHPETVRLVAEVLPENTASFRVFESAGFREQHRILVWKQQING